MLPVSELKNFHPVIVTPSHDGKYFHNYVVSILGANIAAATHQMPLSYSLMTGESLITRARNNAVADFLAHPSYTHLIWVDSDIGFSEEAFLRLLLADRDITAGVYPLKYEGWPKEGLPQGTTQKQFLANYARYPVNSNKIDKDGFVSLKIDDDGFIEVEEAPTGFMCIKRRVFDVMIEAYPHLKYVPDSLDVANNGFHYLFFDCMVHPKSNRYLSEDYAFSYRWNQLGNKVYLDAQSNLSHVGRKTYQGSFGDSLLTNPAHAIGSDNGNKLRIINSKPLLVNKPGPV